MWLKPSPFTGKKLKRRLEELERRAGTSDGASSSGNEKPSPSSKSSSSSKRQSSTKSQKQTPSSPPKQLSRGQYTPPMHDDEYLFPQSYDERERSHTPPGMSYYSTYPPPPEDMGLMAPYGQVHHQSYRPMTTDSYPEYLAATAAVPVTLPSMTHFSDALKREPYSQPEEGMSYMPYSSYMPSGVDMSGGAPSPYDQQMPHVSSLRSLSSVLPPPPPSSSSSDPHNYHRGVAPPGSGGGGGALSSYHHHHRE